MWVNQLVIFFKFCRLFAVLPLHPENHINEITSSGFKLSRVLLSFYYSLPREDEGRERIPHTWASSDENYLKSIFGSASYCVVILKAHLHPNGLATVCSFCLMALLFFSRSDWLPEYSRERENCHIQNKSEEPCRIDLLCDVAPIYGLNLQIFRLLWKAFTPPKCWNYLMFAMWKFQW